MDPREEVNEVLSTPLLETGDSIVTIGTALLVLAIVVVTFIASRLVRKGVEKALRNRLTVDEQAIIVYSRLISLVIIIIGLAWALHATGLDLTAFFAAGGITAVAIGFATQELIANFVSGFVLRLEGAIKLGDVLDVEGRMVKIEKMMMRAVVARDLDEQDIVIPNSVLAGTSVTNYTLRDQKYRLRAPVGVAYGSDMGRVREVLEEVAREIPWRSSAFPPVVLMRQFGSSSVDFEVSVWMDDPWRRQRYRSKLNEAIWRALADAGITIAFPQVDVHFDPAVTDALGRPAGDG
jgi:small-conductance mechanosensitive channel